MSTITPEKKAYAISSENRQFGFSLPLKQTIRIGKREYEVKLKADEKFGTYILWKNRKYPVEIIRSRQNKYEILFNDISYTFTVETPSPSEDEGTQRSEGKSLCEYVKAPMPERSLMFL